MFERYTEKARRVIFFARYEASQFGSPYIEPEHILLGLLREDKALTSRFLGSFRATEDVRTEIEQHTTIRKKGCTSVDLPLSNEAKRVLDYAGEEAERLSHRHIGTEHLLLGLLREEKCFATKLLHDRGIRLEPVREQLSRFPHDPVSPERRKQDSLLAQFSGKIIRSVDQIQPLVGRENELERLISILCRFARNNPVLVGQPGVGKKTIIGGLAERIADGNVPAVLADKSVLALDLSLVAATQEDRTWPDKFQKALTAEGGIFFIDELHTPTFSGKGMIRIAEILKPLLVRGKIQCISTATPSGYAEAIENHRWLEQHFQAVEVAPASEADAVQVLFRIKDEYEKFHGVTYAEDALTCAVYYARCCIRGRDLPGKAVDVIDEAGACVGRRHTARPEEVTELHKRIDFIANRIKKAIANQEFEKARFYTDEERKEREHLRLLPDKYKLDETVTGTVTREHIEDVVARWTGLPIASIRQILANSKKPHP